MITTLRKELTEAGFDWNPQAVIIVQRYKVSAIRYPSGYSAVLAEGQAYALGSSTSDKVENKTIKPEHPLLDLEFDEGYGSANMPKFWCKSPTHIYFPGQYDGRTWVAKVALYPTAYLGEEAETMPYVGG